jgi:hypothetical protein
VHRVAYGGVAVAGVADCGKGQAACADAGDSCTDISFTITTGTPDQGDCVNFLNYTVTTCTAAPLVA